MTPDELAQFLLGLPHVAALLGSPAAPSDLEIEEVGDGNLNFVYICRNKSGEGQGVVAKQALGYVRCVGEAAPLTSERAVFESAALRWQFEVCPEHTPEVYHFDTDLSLIVMRYVEPPHIILRKGLVQGLTYPRLADHMSRFLATTLFFSSSLHLPAPELRRRVAASTNPAMCDLSENVIFTDPYVANDKAAFPNRWTSPQLDDIAAEIKADAALKVAVAALKHKFLTSTEALVHGDLHTGSVMATPESTFVIDPEFAFYGPMGFDIGAFIANLFLAHCAQLGHSNEPAYAQWILQQAVLVWNKFCEQFVALWDDPKAAVGCGSPAAMFAGDSDRKAHQSAFLSRLLCDSLGFAGAKMVRRLVGIAHVEDMDSIADVDKRAACERRALMVGIELVKNAQRYAKIEDAVRMVAGK